MFELRIFASWLFLLWCIMISLVLNLNALADFTNYAVLILAKVVIFIEKLLYYLSKCGIINLIISYERAMQDE